MEKRVNTASSIENEGKEEMSRKAWERKIKEEHKGKKPREEEETNKKHRKKGKS